MFPSKDIPGRVCTKCREFKDSSKFHLRADDPSKTKLRSKCTDCLYGEGVVRGKRRRPNARFPGRAGKSNREVNLFYNYGLTLAAYDAMFMGQGGVCKICKQIGADIRIKNLVVDHDHITGQVRGLLCTACNQGIGMFRDSPDLLIEAATYLEDSKK